VNDRIAHTFGYGNHDIAVYVIVDVKLFPGIINETLYDCDVFNQRWD
jgi:hypothetical protein